MNPKDVIKETDVFHINASDLFMIHILSALMANAEIEIRKDRMKRMAQLAYMRSNFYKEIKETEKLQSPAEYYETYAEIVHSCDNVLARRSMA